MFSNLPENPTLLQLLEEAGANHISILNLHNETRRLEREKKAKEKAMRDLKDTNCIYFGHEVYLERNVFRKEKGKRTDRFNGIHHKKDRHHGKHKELTRKEENGVHGWRSGIIYGCRGNRIVPVGKTDRGYHKNRYSKKEKDFMTCMPETVPFYELNTNEDFHLDHAYRAWMKEQAEKEREEKYKFDDCGFLDYDYDFYDPYDIW